MNTSEKILEKVDVKVNVKVKLALLWAALMFFYIYNDLFSFFQPGHVSAAGRRTFGRRTVHSNILDRRGQC